MKPLAKLGYLAGACVLLVATFSIIGPRAVHAAVAALVQVANTPANPVPIVATDNPALQPYAANAQSSGVALGFAPAPGGKTWVIETMSLFCFSDNGSTISPAQTTDIRLILSTGGTSIQYTFVPTLLPSNQELIVDQTIRAYADPNTFVNIGSGSGIPAGWSCFASLAGHLVNPL
jgi:hypothetical protein